MAWRCGGTWCGHQHAASRHVHHAHAATSCKLRQSTGGAKAVGAILGAIDTPLPLRTPLLRGNAPGYEVRLTTASIITTHGGFSDEL